MTRKNSFSKATWGVRIAGALAVVIGGFWLIAWFTGMAAQDLAAGEVIPKTNTSLCLLLAGMSLLLLSKSIPARVSRMAGAALALIVLLTGALTLSEHLFGWNLGLDQLLLTEAPGARYTISPNRMGLPASLSMALLGAGLLALACKQRKAAVAYLGLLVCLINLVPAVGFIYGIQSFHDLPRLTFIAWHTVVALLLLGFGMMMTVYETGPIALLFRNDPGGALLRKMLPAVILIPLVLGFFRIQGQVMGLYDTATGTGHLTVILILAFLLILWHSADHLSHIASAETKANQAVRESEHRFRTVADFTYDWEFWRGPDGRFLYCSPSCERITGHKAEEFLEDPGLYARLIHPDDRARFDEHMRNVEKQAGLGEIEWRYLHSDGKWRWVGHACRAVFDGQGNFLGTRGSNRDVTIRKQAEETLKASEQRFRTIFETSSMGIAMTGLDRKLIDLNRAAFELYGCISKDELIGKDCFDLVAAEFQEKAAEYWQKVLRDGAFEDVEFVQVRKDGRRIDTLISVGRLDDNAGQPYAMLAVMLDITERKQAEVALRESEARMRAVLDNSPDAIFLKNRDSRLLLANPATFTIIGKPPEACLDKTDAEFYDDPATGRAIMENDRRIMESGRMESFEEIVLWPDGKRVYLSTKAPYRDAEGRIIGIIGLSRDITERKQAQESLEKMSSILSEGQKIAHLGTFEYIADTQTTVWSEEEYRIYGLDPATPSPEYDVLLAKSIHPDDAALLHQTFTAAIKSSSVYELEHRILRPDGSIRWVYDRAHPHFDQNGKLVRYVGATLDITDRKLMDEELRKSRDELEVRVAKRTAELAATNRALTEYALKLDKLNKELQEFAFVASHDLQEPLRKIQTFCDLAKRRCASTLDSTGQDYLDRSVRAATRMRQLLQGLLQYSRITTKAEPFKETDLGKITREAADLFEESLQKSEGKVEIRELPCIEAEESQMLQLFQNLIGNAVKYCSDKPLQITIYCMQDDRECEIFVEDNGIGFDQQFAEKIFMPFQRLHGRGEYEGTGMGLAICRKIVERHGGSIRAKSEEGKGSTFIIRLPVKQEICGGNLS